MKQTIQKFITFLSVLCIFGLSNSIVGAAFTQSEVNDRGTRGHTMSQPYSSFDACQSDVFKFNKLSPDLTRTKCDSWEGSYYYFSCSAGVNCEYKGESNTPKPKPEPKPETKPQPQPKPQPEVTTLDAKTTTTVVSLAQKISPSYANIFEQAMNRYQKGSQEYSILDLLVNTLRENPSSNKGNNNTGNNQAVNACIGSLPSGNGVMSTGIEGKDSTSTTWTYTNLPSSYQCTWTCASGYQKNGNGCVLSNSGSQNQGNNNQSSTQCTGTAPNTSKPGVVIISQYYPSQVSPIDPYADVWTYETSNNGRSCSWTCALGYKRDGNSCIPLGDNEYDLSAVRFDIQGAGGNCQNSSFRRTVYSLPQGVDVKVCEEYKNRPIGDDYTCDIDARFKTFQQAGWSGNSKTTVFANLWINKNNLTELNKYLPGDYRVVLLFPNGDKKYSDWVTFSNSGPGNNPTYNDPNRCSPVFMQFNSVEDIIAEWLKSDKFTAGNIDYDYLSSKLPASCSVQQVKSKLATFWQTADGYSYYHRQGRLIGVLSMVSDCFSKQIPQWTGPTYRDASGYTWNGEKDNYAAFDFQSWYAGGYPWALGGVSCIGGQSQTKGGYKWESGKTVNCDTMTYQGGNTTPPANQGGSNNNGSTKQCEGTTPSGLGIKLNGANALDPSPIRPTWNWVYGTAGHCTWYCDTGYERSGNSCVLKSSTPPASNGNTNFAVTTSKTKLRHTNDTINVTITGANNSLKVCNRIIAHPNSSNSVNLNSCKKKSDFVPLSSASGWTYSNGVWIGKINSNASVAPVGLKWKVFFMMDDDLSKRKWTADLEVIN